ncbi:hypothetical protein AVEN_190945-1 [Araneus ventricosus]|uniref:Uncharacterized protein n=1 Tax=Araneus ventricosus TaxID=182803 RepID=A0A4Y2JI31_ARAVE|nr:hypothetical protein AVEN_190945-1 [Araneus ventricosus]
MTCIILCLNHNCSWHHSTSRKSKFWKFLSNSFTAVRLVLSLSPFKILQIDGRLSDSVETEHTSQSIPWLDTSSQLLSMVLGLWSKLELERGWLLLFKSTSVSQSDNLSGGHFARGSRYGVSANLSKLWDSWIRHSILLVISISLANMASITMNPLTRLKTRNFPPSVTSRSSQVYHKVKSLY